MKFQPDIANGVNSINRHESGQVWVRNTAFSTPVLVPWAGEVQSWPVRDFEELAAEHFAAILALHPELVIFGSGQRLRFPAPALLRTLIDRGIGVETMDTAAACRTYNVLVSEGRSVVAALLVGAAAA